jgi:hypothetical protein
LRYDANDEHEATHGSLPRLPRVAPALDHDIEFVPRSLACRQQPLDPHPLEVVATLASPGS